MRITTNHTEFSRNFTIYPVEGSNMFSISVNQRRVSGVWEGATMNWPACGSQGLTVSQMFMDGMVTARDFVEQLNRNVVPIVS